MNVYFSFKLPETAENLLKSKGYSVKFNKKDKVLSKKELIRAAKDADAIITLLSDTVDREVIDKLNKIKIIANYAVGFNNIDYKYANSKGIFVTNTPGILTDATADLTLALILAVVRKINVSEKFLLEGKFEGWKPELFLGLDLKGKTLGIVGAGRIGQAVARRARAFGMKICYFSKSKKVEFERELKAKKVSLNKLLATSDIVSLHVPLTGDTTNLLSKEKLDLLKKDAILINTARGEVIDEIALINKLRKREILGAGFDVYTSEPNINPKLFKLNNVVLLPHLGSATIETRSRMAELAAKNIISVFEKGRAITPV